MSAAWVSGYLPVLVSLAVAGVVVALYLVKPPPSRVMVASILIWERVLKQARRGRERLRWWLSLLLATFVAIALAVAALSWRHGPWQGPPVRLAVVVDDSATMAARTGDGATRLERALEVARGIIRSHGARSEVWVADTMRRIAVPAYRRREEALAVLEELKPTPGFVPALPLPAESDGAQAFVVTDGVALGPVPAGVRVESVFEPAENVGITALDVRIPPADARSCLAFVEVTNAGGGPRQVELTVAGVGGKRISKMLTLEAHGVRGEVLDLSDFGEGPLRASVRMDADALAADDVAYAAMPARRALRVALVTHGNVFLETALRAQPRVRLHVVAPSRYAGEDGYDLLVFDRHAPKARPHLPALVFRATPADWLPAVRGEAAGVSVAQWNALHPLLENVSLRDLAIGRTALVDPGTSVSVLARTPAGAPLIMVRERAPRWIELSFDLQDSNFALHAGFPVFLANAVDWMLDDAAVKPRALGTVHLPIAHARVLAVDGKDVPVQSVADGSLFEADAPGLYTAVGSDDRMRVAVNVLDRRVTGINRSVLGASGPAVHAVDGGGLSSGIDFAGVLLLIAALLLLFDWWAWTRRITV
ncbi:MAG TPA: hypothetical protein VFV71_07990 [Burkholderiales bacterium]|nr:hypothetical protein [Burkholderiales bacterium]